MLSSTRNRTHTSDQMDNALVVVPSTLIVSIGINGTNGKLPGFESNDARISRSHKSVSREEKSHSRHGQLKDSSSTKFVNSEFISYLSPEDMEMTKWTEKNCFSESFAEPVEEIGGERETWEFHNIMLTRVPGYGFGIAVSGGRDNPHFANGDPSIAISDVLKAGPAEGRLKINDRVITANNTSLENVDYATAVKVLRECGNTVNLGIKRRIIHSPNTSEPQAIKVTLTKNRKKDDFGIVLACRIYVKEITNHFAVDKDNVIQEGDVIAKINNASTNNLTLKEARKLIENSKERLELVILRENGRPTRITNECQQWSSNNVYELPENKNFQGLQLPPSLPTIDISSPHSRISNQNLYVQPPTRGECQLSSNHYEDKNNLLRVYNQNCDQLKDSTLIDQNMVSDIGEERQVVGNNEIQFASRSAVPRISDLNRRNEQSIDEALLRKRNIHLPEPRFISFRKDGSLGIRLSGGNDIGIFVAAVHSGSPAALQGLQLGDKILKVNDIDMRGVTREEAVHLLLGIHNEVNLVVQHCKEEYDEAVSKQKSDSFYIRTHFKYDGSAKGELNFHVGEIFHVIDTLHNGNTGAWVVYRLGRNNQQLQKGIIPNQSRAEEIVQNQLSNPKKNTSTESRGSFFKRRSARRSKSLSRDHWEEIVFGDCLSKFPPYVRVVLKHPGFPRPVVLFGPMANTARSRLLRDHPNVYDAPQLESNLDDLSGIQKCSGITRLSAIKDIIDKGKHALVDITPSAVDRLNYAQFYPIVIFLRADNKHIIKELNCKEIKSGQKSSRKLYEYGMKLEKLWSHIFTATVTLTSNDIWYKKVQEIIEKQQQLSIWMTENVPEEVITDDFLFPMTSRLSYVSPSESEIDFCSDIKSLTYDHRVSKLSPDKLMIKASSDPSIAMQECLDQISNYGTLSMHSVSRPKQEHSPSHSMKKEYSNSNDFQTMKQNSIEYYQLKPRAAYQPPPLIDRECKPSQYRSAQERLFNTHDMRVPRNRSPDYINTCISREPSVERQSEHRIMSEAVNYSSAPCNKYGTLSSPLRDAVGDRCHTTTMQRTPHDPYRFTRSTAQPARPTTLDGKLTQTAYRNRQSNERPAPPLPPPKPVGYPSRLNDGRPIPPPKPNSYVSRQSHSQDKLYNGISLAKPPDEATSYSSNRNNFTAQAMYYARTNHNTEIIPSYSQAMVVSGNSQSSHHDIPSSPMCEDIGGQEINKFNHGYDTYSYSKHADCNSTNIVSRTGVINGRAYVPDNSNHHSIHSQHMNQPLNSLDLSSRDLNHGSAFELYHKPMSQLMPEIAPPLPPPPIEQSKSQISNNNHNAIATVRDVFGEAGGVLTSEETGVSVMIPPGALSDYTEIYFRVFQDRNMLPPLDREKGETLLSPLVLCGPPGLTFNLPVELRLPHCASVHPQNWSFALKSSDAPYGKPLHWQNMSLDTKNGTGQSYIQDGYVSVLVDHF